MDIEKFDRLYPSPAHAAAADLRDRYAPRHLQPEPRSLVPDRSGIVIGVAALTAAFLGGAAYVLTAGQTLKPTPSNRKIQVSLAVPAAEQLAPTARVLPVPAQPIIAPRSTIVAGYRTRAAPELEKPVPERKGSSGWILDPLSGDALAAALVIDKQRTIELNAQQLGKMTREDIQPLPTVDAGGESPDRS